MRMIVLTNPKAGEKADGVGALEGALRRAGAIAEVRQVPGDHLTEAARQAAGENVSAVIAAGGDGTVSAVAAALVGQNIPMGILPTGTLNHFARDLGLPVDLDSAAAVIAAGHGVAVDVGQLNGQTFVNNASIGLYPRIVDRRDQVRQRLGYGKWVSMLVAFLAVFRRYPTVRVRIDTGERRITCTTPLVFVGNNQYETRLTMLGRRQRLDEGILSVYFAKRPGRFGLLRLSIRALVGRLEQTRDFDTLSVTETWIETPRPMLRVALDGEVLRLEPPLHFTIRPGALQVLAPRDRAGSLP